jgi:CheY-like chemotaxis protein
MGVVASNGLEALEKIRKVATLKGPREGIPFDCVLMDLEMPGEPRFRNLGNVLMGK